MNIWKLILLSLVLGVECYSAGISIQPENGSLLLQIPFTCITDYPVSIKYNPLIEKGAAGAKWQCSLDTELQAEEGSPLYLVKAYCTEYLFFKDIVGNFTSSPGTFSTLSYGNGNYTMASNNGEKLTFDPSGALKTIQDRAGKTAELERDPSGRISIWRIKADTIEGFSSDSLLGSGQGKGLSSGGSVEWDENALVKSITNGDVKFDFTYINGKIDSVKSSSGDGWLFSYDESGRLNGLYEPDHFYFISYWPDGKVKTVNDLFGDSIYVEYVDEGETRTTSVWNLSNYTHTRYEYLPKKILITRSPIDGEPVVNAEIDIETNHRLVTAKNGDRLEFIPLNNGEIEIVTALRGYLPFTLVKNFDETVIRNINSIECFREVRAPSSFDLAACRDKIRTNGIICDLENNILEVIQNDINTAKFLYTKFNSVREIAVPYGGNFNIKYDSSNRIKLFSAPYGRQTKFSYSDKENSASIEMPDGSRKEFKYDEYGDLTEIREPMDRITRMTYFARGDVESVEMKDFDTQSLTFARDQGLIVCSSSIFGQYLFQDHYGTKMTRIAPDGTVTNFDMSDKNITKIADNDNNTVSEFSYNEYGEATSASSPGCDILFGYDQYGRLENKDYKSAGLQIKYAYSKDDMISEVSDSKGFKINYIYNERGGLKEIQNQKAGTFKFAYGSNGLINSIDLPNGIRVFWKFNENSDICEYGYKMKSGKTVANRYSYDTIGNISGIANTAGGSAKYSYDKLSFLSGVKHGDGKTTEVSYDKWGNLLSYDGRTVTYRKPGLPENLAGNRADTENSSPADSKTAERTYKCDDSGRISEYSEGKDKYRFHYDWNNRISGLELNGANINEWTYGPFGNELWESKKGNDTTRYFYTGRDIYATENKNNGELTRYIFLPGLDIPLAVVRPGGEVDYPLCDASGTVVYLTDKNGSIKEQRRFDMLGNMTGRDDMNIPLGFAGGLGFTDGKVLFIGQSQYFIPLQRRISKTGIMPGEFNLDFSNTLSFLDGNPLELINRNNR